MRFFGAEDPELTVQYLGTINASIMRRLVNYASWIPGAPPLSYLGPGLGRRRTRNGRLTVLPRRGSGIPPV